MLKQKICKCVLCCWKIYFYLPIAVLLFWVYYPFVLNLFNSNTELLDNRALHTKPQKLSANFAKEFTDYYNDTFAKRKKLIVKYVKLKQKLKIDTGQYFHGKDGWMFYDSAKVNNANSMLDYYGTVMFSDKELEKMRIALETEKEFYNSFGAKYMVVVAPNKENLYTEFMPDRMQKMRVSENSPADVGAEWLNKNSKVEVLNFKSVLQSAKSDYPYHLYYKKDTHWNEIGGYVAVYNLLKRLQKFGVGGSLVPLTEDMISFVGMIGQDMHPTDKDESYKVEYLADKSFTKNILQLGKVVVYENDNPVANDTIMLMGDSFAEAMLPYLAKNYRKVVNIASGVKDLSFYEEAMKEYKPKVVVYELVERYFRTLVNRGKLYGIE